MAWLRQLPLREGKNLADHVRTKRDGIAWSQSPSVADDESRNGPVVTRGEDKPPGGINPAPETGVGVGYCAIAGERTSGPVDRKLCYLLIVANIRVSSVWIERNPQGPTLRLDPDHVLVDESERSGGCVDRKLRY